MIGIYKIISPSGKIYIGLSKDIEGRWRGYSVNKKTAPHQRKLYYSFKKYGIENHKFEILEECKFEELNEKEIYYIKKYNSVEKGLNISKGGYSFWEVNIGKKHKETTIKKMKEWWSINAQPRSDETIKKIKETKLKNPRTTTEEMIQKFRKSSPTKKAVFQYDLEKNFIAEYESINEAARYLGVGNDSISACCRGKQKTAGGYIWEYKK